MVHHESRAWKIVWELPIIGNLLQLFVLFLPVIAIGLIAPTSDESDPGTVLLTSSIVELAWLWVLERFANTRLVTPIIPIPWLWIFVVMTIYSIALIVDVI